MEQQPSAWQVPQQQQQEAQQAQQLQPRKEELHVFVGGGARPTVYRLTRRKLWLWLFLLLIAGCLLILLFAYWDAKRLLPSAPGALSLQLESEVRVLCWVLTTPKYHKTRAVHVLRTWGKRCNKIYFMTSEPDDELETIVLSKPDKYELLWGKTKEAFTHIYEHKLHEADWFMKADDDTYVFMENLRYMLYPYSPELPIYFGFNFKLMDSELKNASYMSGGSGYVLSREALRRFVHGLNDSSKCREQDDHAEDMEAGRCLHNVGVLAGDSRDAKMRNRFQPMAPYSTLISSYYGLDFWYFKYAYYNPRTCMDCLSDYPVAFHYVSPAEQYVYDYFNYKFELHGRRRYKEQLPAKLTAAEQLVIPAADNAF